MYKKGPGGSHQKHYQLIDIQILAVERIKENSRNSLRNTILDSLGEIRI